MISSWLMPSRVRFHRPTASNIDGILTSSYAPVPGLEYVQARVEVNFFRPGKDIPLPAQAGRAPDRTAVYWIAPDIEVMTGDRMECVSGPVTGTWEIRARPDPAQGMGRAHHQEGQCVEVTAASEGEVL